MTIQEALNLAGPYALIYRKKWRDEGSTMKLYTSNKIIDLIDVKLTEESFFATDWELFTTTTGDNT